MNHAETELKILKTKVPDAIIAPFSEEIIALYNKFMESGQSGGSAPYTAQAISQAVKSLLMNETISPLTGEDWEWQDVSEHNDGKTLFQNMRDSRVFKYEDGRCFYIDAIVWDGDIGGRFTGWINTPLGEVSSNQQIKSFPFTPKTFYVPVKDYRWKDKKETELDPDGDWWTHRITEKGLVKLTNEVWEYYKKPSELKGSNTLN